MDSGRTHHFIALALGRLVSDSWSFMINSCFERSLQIEHFIWPIIQGLAATRKVLLKNIANFGVLITVSAIN